MANSMPDSMPCKSVDEEELGEASLKSHGMGANQKIANILGAMAAQSPRSVAANTAKKMYKGW